MIHKLAFIHLCHFSDPFPLCSSLRFFHSSTALRDAAPTDAVSGIFDRSFQTTRPLTLTPPRRAIGFSLTVSKSKAVCCLGCPNLFKDLGSNSAHLGTSPGLSPHLSITAPSTLHPSIHQFTPIFIPIASSSSFLHTHNRTRCARQQPSAYNHRGPSAGGKSFSFPPLPSSPSHC